MNTFDDITRYNIKEHSPNWSQVPNHPYKILILGSGKANVLV